MKFLREGQRALVYLRLSGVQDDELSPDIQLKLNLKTCANLGLEVDARFLDGAIVGQDVYADTEKGFHSAFKRDNMGAWLALIERARTDESVVAVVAYDLSRVFRNVQAMLEETKQLNALGVQLVLNNKPVNLSDPHEWAMWVDAAKHAEFESRLTTWRLLGHYAELRDLNIYYAHNAPMGLTRSGTKHKVKWTTNDDFPTIRLMFELYATGEFSPTLLAIELNARGLTWNNYGKRVVVQARTVEEALKRIDRYAPFLEPELVLAVKAERARRSDAVPRVRRHKRPNMLLQNVLFCAGCDAPYYAEVKKARGVLRYSYFHRPSLPKCGNAPYYIAAHKLETQFLERLDERAGEIEAHKEEIIAAMVRNPAPQTDTSKLQREKLEQRLRGYEEMRADGDITKDQFRAKRKEIQDELDALPQEPPPDEIALTENEARAYVENMMQAVKASITTRTVRLMVKRILVRNGIIESVEWV